MLAGQSISVLSFVGEDTRKLAGRFDTGFSVGSSDPVAFFCQVGFTAKGKATLNRFSILFDDRMPVY